MLESKKANLIKDSVIRLYNAQQEKQKFDEYYKKAKEKEQILISNFMFTNLPKGVETFDILLDETEKYYVNPVKLKVTRVRRKKVTWLVDKLKKKLSKETYKAVVDKTYIINNMEGLIEYLKSCNVNPKEFKKFIDVEEQVNETLLNNLYETGKIKRNEVKDCYNIEMGEPYIKLTKSAV